MSDKKDTSTSEADAELEREIRSQRKFTLSEAIGRMAGPGAMKGVSPISRKQQTENEIGAFLSTHLPDTSGALRTVLIRRLGASEQVYGHYDHPLQFLAKGLRYVLANDECLKNLVTEADIEWGAITGERPYFEKEGCSPHPDDPYTLESVKKSLSNLLEVLQSSGISID